MANRPQIFRPTSARSRSETRREADQRRGSARERGYTAQWDKQAKDFLADHPLCLGCEAVGRIEAAVLVDHVVPHGGDRELFWDRGNWQACCKWHHDAVKQRLEAAFARSRIDRASLALDSDAARSLTIEMGGGAGQNLTAL